MNEVLSVGILTFGITLFCSGEARDAPAFDMIGVFLMLIGVILDSLTSNYEKKQIFSYRASHCEAMFFASLMGFVWSFVTMLATESTMMIEATYFFIANPNVCYLLGMDTYYVCVCF